MRRFITGILISTSRFLQRVAKGLLAMAAGICDRKSLMHHSQRIWDRWEFMQNPDHIFSGLMEWEKELYKTYLPPQGTIGIIGCGAGRDQLSLSQMGFKTEGVDFSPKAITLAKEHLSKNGIDPKVHCANIFEFDFPEQRYDAFIFSWFTYSFLPGSENRILLLRKLHEKLAPEGCIILTFYQSEKQVQGSFNKLALFVSRITNNPHPPVLGDRFTNEFNYSHCFTRKALTNEVGAAHLEVIHYGDQPEGVAVLKMKQETK